jgi:hypothetical protein
VDFGLFADETFLVTRPYLCESVVTWEEDASFQKLSKFVSHASVVNDQAERQVSLSVPVEVNVLKMNHGMPPKA